MRPRKPPTATTTPPTPEQAPGATRPAKKARVLLLVAVDRDGSEKNVALFTEGTADPKRLAAAAGRDAKKTIVQFNLLDAGSKPPRLIDVLVPTERKDSRK